MRLVLQFARYCSFDIQMLALDLHESMNIYKDQLVDVVSGVCVWIICMVSNHFGLLYMRIWNVEQCVSFCHLYMYRIESLPLYHSMDACELTLVCLR